MESEITHPTKGLKVTWFSWSRWGHGDGVRSCGSDLQTVARWCCFVLSVIMCLFVFNVSFKVKSQWDQCTAHWSPSATWVSIGIFAGRYASDLAYSWLSRRCQSNDERRLLQRSLMSLARSPTKSMLQQLRNCETRQTSSDRILRETSDDHASTHRSTLDALWMSF